VRYNVAMTTSARLGIDYRLAADDERGIAEGVVRAARVIEAAGARKIYSLHRHGPSYMPGVPGSYEKWAQDTKRLG
jgi:long-chain-alcohol oxidase